MILDEDQKKTMVEYFERKWPAPKACPVCQRNEWQVNDKVFEIREYQGGGFVIGSGSIVPVIVAVCTNCGNIVFFNAIRLGIVKPEKEAKNE